MNYLTKHLTNREVQIVELLCKGFSDFAIADQLNISTHTVKTHLRNIYSKTDLRSRSELIVGYLNNTDAKEGK